MYEFLQKAHKNRHWLYLKTKAERELGMVTSPRTKSNTTTMLPDLKNKRHTLKKMQISINLEIYLFQWGCPK